MANLLFRIGRASAARPFVAIVAWLLTLATAGGAFVGFGGTLTDSFSIPGLETERVTDQLAQEIPGLDGGNARMVFRTEDGAPFAAEQRAGIATALAATEGVDSVTGVIDPFATEAAREVQLAQLAAAPDQLAAARAELEAGQAQLDAGQAQLDAAVAQAREAGTYELAEDQFTQQQATLDAQRERVGAGLAEIDAQATQLDLGARLADAAAAVRTVSEDGATALGIVQFDTGMYEVDQADKEAVIAAVEAAAPEGVAVYFPSDLANDVSDVLGVGEIVGVALAFVVLLVMMRAIWPAVQPILTSVLGVGVGVATSLAFSGVVEMSSVTPVLGVMLALAVGIDYSLFIVNRHREQLRRGMDVRESVGLATGTSGNAVVFAGATVIVALLALNVTGIPFLGIMGSVGAFAVGVAVLAAVTLTPALLGLIGTRALGRRARATIGSPEHAEPPARPMRTGRALAALVASAAALLVVAIPALSMRLGLPDGTQDPEDSTQYRAYTTAAAAFGEGVNGTLLVTAELPEAVGEPEVTAAQVAVTETLLDHPDVVAVAPAGVSDDRDFLAFQAIPSEGPSSESTADLVRDLRALSPLGDGTRIGVAGEASGTIDVSQKLDDALPLYLAVVVGLSFVILVVVFRSLLVPLVATLGFVLSLFAAFGALTAVYQWGWLSDIFGVHSPGPVLSFLPILLTGILFGLAMDYQLFLTTGMREAYVHGVDARRSVVVGLRHGRGVVTAAAIIMMSVFGGFVFSHLAMIRPMGFGLAIGVLFDAFVVRMVIVPSLMHLVGERAWWLPAWLDRIIPNVDVEGAALERAHPFPHAQAAPAHSH